MNINRITVLKRHTKQVAAVLGADIINYKEVSINGVKLIHFICKGNQSLFGIPYSIETISIRHAKATKMHCYINNAGKPCYIPEGKQDAMDWKKQEEIFLVKEGGITPQERINLSKWDLHNSNNEDDPINICPIEYVMTYLNVNGDFNA